MSMNITQHELDRAGLVVIVGDDGLFRWSSKRSREEVVDMLRGIADDIESGMI